MFYYIKCGPNGTPTSHVEKVVAFAGYNTAADSAINGKPYYVEAIMYDAVPTDSQVRVGPVYDANGGTITYTVRDKTPEELRADRLYITNFAPKIRRQAAAMEAAGDTVGALLLLRQKGL